MNADAEKKVPEWAKRKPMTLEATITELENLARAAYSMARTTNGDADVRAGLMDRCHTLREALRHMGASPSGA